MPKYDYEAKQGPAKKIRGVLEAESRSECIAKLSQKGYFPLFVTESGEGRQTPMAGFFRGRVSPRDVESFTRELANLLESGLPLLRALKVLQGQKHRPVLARVITQMSESIRDGQSFSDSLARFPHVFSDMYVNMVRSGEVSGHLELVLSRLADFYERQDELRSKIRAALAYPVLMVGVGVLAICALLVFVVPTIAEMFADLDQSLPLPTQFFIYTSSFITRYGWAVLTAVVLLFLLARRALDRPDIRVVLERLWFRLPFIGDLSLKNHMTHLARTLGTLLEGGVPILSSLEVAERTVPNELFRRQLRAIHEEVAQGSSLAASLGKRPFFPALVTNLVSVGEEGGQLERALMRVATTYDRDARRSVEVLTSLLEPVLILSLGSVMGLIVISMLLPIFELNVLIR